MTIDKTEQTIKNTEQGEERTFDVNIEAQENTPAIEALQNDNFTTFSTPTESNYVAAKSSVAKTNLLGFAVTQNDLIGASPLNDPFLSFSERQDLTQLGSALLFEPETLSDISNSLTGFFDSITTQLPEATSLTFSSVSIFVSDSTPTIIISTPPPATVSPFIFGTNANDLLIGSGGDDIINGNVLSANNPISLVQAIASPSGVALDFFGGALDLSDGVAIIGAGFNDTGASNSGLAYIYDTSTGALLHTLNNPTPAGFDLFGVSVAIDGNIAIVGAPRDDTDTTDSGLVYVYDVTTGAVLRTLNNPTPEASDFFGSDVDIEGNFAIVSASDNTGASNTGAVYIFDVTTGALLNTLNNPTPEANDGFGTDIAISGNNVLVGALFDDTGFTDSGAAYIFDLATGALRFTLNNPAPAINDFFGQNLALSDQYAVLGVRDTDIGGDSSVGTTYVYDVNTGALLHTLENPTPAATDDFGTGVSISGDYIAVGAAFDDTGGTSSGIVHIFDAVSGNLLHTLSSPAPLTNEGFGFVLSIEGNTLLIGSLLETAHVFQVDFGDADILRGGDGDDTLFGLFGDDVLFGEGGADFLSGGDGADRFVFEAASAFTDLDTVQDFDQTQDDVLDISDILTGYTNGVSDITDFARFVDNGADTVLEIDADGAVGGANFQAAALIIGGAGLDASALEVLGQLDAVV